MPPIGEHRDPRWVAPEQPAAVSAPPSADGVASLPKPAHLWWEIAAVACIAVFPSLYEALDSHDLPEEYRSESRSWAWLLAHSVFISIPVLWIARRGGMTWRELGIVRPRPIDALSVTIVTTLCLGVGWLAWMVFLALQGSEPRSDPWKCPGGDDLDPGSVAARGAVATVLAVAAHLANGFAEELAMRGYLMTRLRTATGSAGTAVVLSTAAFTSYHVYQDGYGVTSVAVFGVVAALAFLALRNLWVVALSHALMNLWLEFVPYD